MATKRTRKSAVKVAPATSERYESIVSKQIFIVPDITDTKDIDGKTFVRAFREDKGEEKEYLVVKEQLQKIA